MADKFTQKIYAYPDGGVETIQLQNYFPRGTVNSTSDFLLCCMEFDTCVGNNIFDLETHGGGSIVIVCNSSTSQWNCRNDTACKSISNETIKAPAPSARSAIVSPTSRPYSSSISFSASSSSTSSSLVTTPSSSETSSKIDSSPISSSSTTPSPSPSSSLFPGAIAGISISSVIFLAFLALLTYFLLRNRKNNHNHKQKLNQTKGEAYVKTELAGESADRGNSGQLAEERVGRSQAWELQGGGREGE